MTSARSAVELARIELPRIELSEKQFLLISKALADPRRTEILRQIGRSGDTMACASVLGCMEVSAATISHHMKELEIAGLVDSEREGKFVTYRLCRDVLQAYLARLAEI